jgi:hypothetical protein
MGLEIFGHGVSGEILVEDQRPDGSTILLQCTRYGQTASSAPSGVTVASSAGGSWPMLQEAGIARKRRGKLHLDTTQMPGGVLTFNVCTLAEKAAEALDSGIRFMELTLDNAKEWGYSEPLRPVAEETVDMPAAASARGTAARRGGSSQGRPHNAPAG